MEILGIGPLEMVAILIVNPDNPTGMVYPLESLHRIVELAREFNLFVVSGLTGTSVLPIAGRAVPYVIGMACVVLLLAYIPWLSLWALQ